MTHDRIRLSNIRDMAEILIIAMKDDAFVTEVDMCDIVNRVESIARDAATMESAEFHMAGLRVATSISALARAYINSRSLAVA